MNSNTLNLDVSLDFNNPPNLSTKQPLQTLNNNNSNNNNHNNNNNNNDLSLNLNDLFSNPKANNIITNLLQTVQQQSKEIRQLQLQSTSSVGISSFQSTIKILTDKLNESERRITNLEKSINLKSTDCLSIGCITNSNRRAIAKTLEIVTTKCDSKEITNSLSNLSTNIELQILELEKRVPSMATSTKTLSLISGVTDKLHSMEVQIGTKTEITDITQIKIDALIIRNSKEVIESNVRRINELEDCNRSNVGNIKHLLDQSRENSHIIGLVKKENDKLASNDEYQKTKKIVNDLEKLVYRSDEILRREEFNKILLNGGKNIRDITKLKENVSLLNSHCSSIDERLTFG